MEVSGRYIENDRDLAACLRAVRHIVLIGISLKPERPSHQVMAFLLESGFEVTPINPGLAGQTLMGREVRADLTALDRPADMVDVFRAPDALGEIVDATLTAHIPVLWTQLGVINRPATDDAVRGGLTVIVDKCPKQEIPRLAQLGLWTERRSQDRP